MNLSKREVCIVGCAVALSVSPRTMQLLYRSDRHGEYGRAGEDSDGCRWRIADKTCPW